MCVRKAAGPQAHGRTMPGSTPCTIAAQLSAIAAQSFSILRRSRQEKLASLQAWRGRVVRAAKQAMQGLQECVEALDTRVHSASSGKTTAMSRKRASHHSLTTLATTQAASQGMACVCAVPVAIACYEAHRISALERSFSHDAFQTGFASALQRT